MTEYRDEYKVRRVKKRLDELDEEDDTCLIFCCGPQAGAFTQDREREKRKLDRELQIELAKPLRPITPNY